MPDIKTRESLRSIKTFERAKNIAGKVKTGAGEVKEYADELQNNSYESENEYAGNTVQSTEERLIRNTAYGSMKVGNWGMRETAKNIRKFKSNRRMKENFKVRVDEPKQLMPPQRRQLPSGSIKTAEKTSGKTLKATEKTVKDSAKVAKKTAEATIKASKKAAEAAKKAAESTAKAIKATVKAVATAVKAVVSAVKGIIAAIAAGGWIAVLVIVLICIVALVLGSIFCVFSSDNTTESGVTIADTVRTARSELYGDIEKIKSEYTYDMCYVTGEPCDYSFAVAVYAVKVSNSGDAAVYDDNKVSLVKEIYRNINSYTVHTEQKTEMESRLVKQQDGTYLPEDVPVTKTYLYIEFEPMTKDEVILFYGFDKTQMEQFEQLLSDDTNEMWKELLE